MSVLCRQRNITIREKSPRTQVSKAGLLGTLSGSTLAICRVLLQRTEGTTFLRQYMSLLYLCGSINSYRNGCGRRLRMPVHGDRYQRCARIVSNHRQKGRTSLRPVSPGNSGYLLSLCDDGYIEMTRHMRSGVMVVKRS